MLASLKYYLSTSVFYAVVHLADGEKKDKKESKKDEIPEIAEKEKVDTFIERIDYGLDQIATWLTLLALPALLLVGVVVGIMVIITKDSHKQAAYIGWMKTAVFAAVFTVAGAWFLTWVFKLLTTGI